ncbi:MAG: RNase adapter RapZ [Gammaproteobacteria bacterium]
MELVVVGGLSGSGKSVALAMLEDLEWYTLDNVPARLLSLVVGELIMADDPKFSHLAIGLDSRPRAEDLPVTRRLLEDLRARGIHCQLVFLHASEPVLVQRYLDTRRRHPHTPGVTGDRTLAEAISFEQALLTPLAEFADHVFDTSTMSVHELRDIIRDRVAGQQRNQVSLQFESFGFRQGIPKDADFVFDARFLPNPYWEPELRKHTGRDPGVIEYLAASPEVEAYLRDIKRFLGSWLGRIEAANRSYLTVAIGCTGGRHRSVYLAERLAEYFQDDFPGVAVRHAGLEHMAAEQGAAPPNP